LVVLGALLWQILQRAVARSFELTVGHF
jgi:hypothetical protein